MADRSSPPKISFSRTTWIVGYSSILNNLVVFAEICYFIYYSPELAKSDGTDPLSLFIAVFLLFHFMELAALYNGLYYMRNNKNEIKLREWANYFTGACFTAISLKLIQLTLLSFWAAIRIIVDFKKMNDAGTPFVPFYSYYTFLDYLCVFVSFLIPTVHLVLPWIFVLLMGVEQQKAKIAAAAKSRPQAAPLTNGYSPLVDA